MTNRFKGLDMTDRVPEELWMEVLDIGTGGRNEHHPQENEIEKAKLLSEEALEIAEKRQVKGKGEKEGYTHLNAEFQKWARRNKRVFLRISEKK